MTVRVHTVPLLAAVSLATAGCVSWLRGSTNVLADTADNFGQPLAAFGNTAANVWCLVAAAAILVASYAVDPPGQRMPRRCATTVAVGGLVVAVLVLDHTLLMLLGYLPMALGMVVAGRGSELQTLLSPGLGVQIVVAGAVASVVLRLLRQRERRRQAERGSDAAGLEAATRRTRTWAKVAIEAPLVYALSRVLMFLQVPGFGGLEGAILVAGLGLAAAACAGAALTWGLVAPWGERFPRWMVGLSRRRVPVGLAVVPALVVSALIAAASRGMVVELVTADAAEWREQLRAPLIVAPQLLWPLWSLALALAALAYQDRRRIADGLAADEGRSAPAASRHR